MRLDLARRAEFADAVLKGCPNVTVLATSREALGIGGEQTYRVPSMALPDPEQADSPGALMEFDAVRLFVERATLGQPEFQPSDQNAPALASICRRLDGIPLAIELAAAGYGHFRPKRSTAGWISDSNS